MSAFFDPYDPNRALGSACSCGQHATQSAHDSADHLASDEPEVLSNRIIESAMVRALFPHDETRRRFIRAVGVNTAVRVKPLPLIAPSVPLLTTTSPALPLQVKLVPGSSLNVNVMLAL